MSKPDSATDVITYDGKIIVSPKMSSAKLATLVSWSSSLLFRIMSEDISFAFYEFF